MGVDPNLRTPYVINYSLDIQKAITNNVSLDIGYVGNHGTKLIGALDINQPVAHLVTVPGVNGGNPFSVGPGYTAAGLAACAATPTTKTCAPNAALEQAARPFTQFPYFKFIDEFGNYDTSNYNGLQAVLTARNFHGLTLTSGYTYSHALGDSSDQGTSGGLVIPINSDGNLHNQLYTSTAFDMRHRFTVSGTYAIPGKKSPGQILEGWSITSVATIETGTPWGVSDSSTDFAGTGEQTGNSQGNEGGQWSFLNAQGGPGNPADFLAVHNFTNVTPAVPNGAPGIPFFVGSTQLANPRPPMRACNSAAATMGPLATASLRVLGCYALGSSVLIPPPYGGYGTMPRTPWRDQGFRNMDLSVTKQFKFKERLTAQFRAEVFNILNHPNFVNPFGGPGGGGASLNPSRAGSTGAGLGFVSNTPDQAGSNPVLGSGGARDIQLGLKLIF